MDMYRKFVHEIETLIDIIIPLVPPHHGSCCVFDDGKITVSEESCICSPESKKARKIIYSYRGGKF